MTVRNTFLLGEAVLRETALPVRDVENLTEVITDLTDTMRAEELAGMSAPQIGESLRLFVTEIRETKYRTGQSDPLRVYINPEITEFSRETALGWEGCGSIPGLFGKVERPVKISLKYLDQEGVSREMKADGLLARIIQHEVDHLNGILFTDTSDPSTFVSAEYYIKHYRGK